MLSEKRDLASADEECVCVCVCVCVHAASPDAPTPMISTAAASPVTTFPFDGISLYMLCNQIQRSYPLKEIDSRKEKRHPSGLHYNDFSSPK